MRTLFALTLAAWVAVLTLGWDAPPARLSAAPLAQATATPTPTATPTATPTPLAAPGWDRVDQPDGNVRCYWATWNGQPFGGCVVVP